MTKRLVDINGEIIHEPEYYHESLVVARKMVDKMEVDGIDRSDMLVIVQRLHEEVRFTLLMLSDRE